MIHISFDG
jgi:hypothetical protein